MQQDNSTFQLSEYWSFLLRLLHSRRWTALTFLSVTFFVVGVGTSLQTPIYDASATVLIDMEPPSVLAVSTSRDDSTVAQTNYLTYADYYRTQLEVIKSRHIASRVVANLKLGAPGARFGKEKDPVGALLKQIDIDPIKQTRLVVIHAEDPSPRLAAQIANEFAFIFVSENMAKAASNEAMNLMKNEYLKLQSKEAELSKRYKAKFPAMMRLHEQMNQLAGAIEKELSRQLSDDRAIESSGPGEEAQKPADLVPVTADVEQRSGGSLFRDLQQKSMVGGLRPNNIRVQDLARIPTKKSKPRVFMNLVLGLFLGVIGGIGAAAIEELLDGTIKVPKDLERDKRFVFLGHIPKIPDPDEDGSGGGVTPKESSAFCRHIQLKTGSEVAEAYRMIRTNLIYAAPDHAKRTILFTSPGSGEGKTTTASNLAIAFSQLGLKVLLIDADMRKPSLHAGFGVLQSPGLSEFLNGRNSFQDVIHRSGIGELSIVPSGVCPANPAELLALPKMQEFLKQAESKFDRVLIDAPPILPVTDATLLAAFTRSVVAIVQSGKTPWQALDRLSVGCQGVGATILGVILNHVTGFDVPQYGYGHQLYPYGQNFPEEKKDPLALMVLKSTKRWTGAIKERLMGRKPTRGNLR